MYVPINSNSCLPSYGFWFSYSIKIPVVNALKIYTGIINNSKPNTKGHYRILPRRFSKVCYIEKYVKLLWKHNVQFLNSNSILLCWIIEKVENGYCIRPNSLKKKKMPLVPKDYYYFFVEEWMQEISSRTSNRRDEQFLLYWTR